MTALLRRATLCLATMILTRHRAWVDGFLARAPPFVAALFLPPRKVLIYYRELVSSNRTTCARGSFAVTWNSPTLTLAARLGERAFACAAAARCWRHSHACLRLQVRYGCRGISPVCLYLALLSLALMGALAAAALPAVLSAALPVLAPSLRYPSAAWEACAFRIPTAAARCKPTSRH